jgi:hypothetical protein
MGRVKKLWLRTRLAVITTRAEVVEQRIVHGVYRSEQQRYDLLYQLNILVRAKYDLRQRLKRG